MRAMHRIKKTFSFLGYISNVIGTTGYYSFFERKNNKVVYIRKYEKHSCAIKTIYVGA